MRKDLIKNYYNQDNKVFGSILVICLMVLLVGFSYAFFVYNKTGLYTHTITGGRLSIIYSETTGNNITIDNAYPLRDEEALTKGLEFEFTITGYNESDKNIYYAIEMDYGEDIENKERFKDSDLKLSLYENEEKIFENEVFSNLDNQNVHYGMINHGTSSESPVTNNYKLRIWINDYVIISDTLSDDLDTWTDFEWYWLWENYPEIDDKIYYDDYSSNSLAYYGMTIYTSEEFAKRYANFKVNVKADLKIENSGYIYYDANGGSFTPTKTSLLNGRITLQKPLVENKGFLGWSSTPDGKVEYNAGDYYTGDGKILYAIYSDTINLLSYIPSIYSTFDCIKFVNRSNEYLESIFDNEDIYYKYDLTEEGYGLVVGWEESVYNVGIDKNERYLYIGSEGTTYFTDNSDIVKGCKAYAIDFANVDTSLMTSMESMFYGCDNLVKLDLSGFNTSNVTNMSTMFVSYDSSFQEIDVSNFDTSNVKNMNGMFYTCHKVTSLDVRNWDVSSVEDMSGMFMSCGITMLDVSKWDTSNVEDMSSMFCYCSNLVSLDVSNLNTSNVQDMQSMFEACSSLRSLNLKKFDVSNVILMTKMFSGCSDITSLDLTSFDMHNVTDVSNMFYNCQSLVTIYHNDNWSTFNITPFENMFTNCYLLVGAVPYNENFTDITMANSDTGYFTKKTV